MIFCTILLFLLLLWVCIYFGEHILVPLLLTLRSYLPTGHPPQSKHWHVQSNNRNTRKLCEICSKLIIKITKRYFVVTFEQISHLLLVFLLLNLSTHLFVGLAASLSQKLQPSKGVFLWSLQFFELIFSIDLNEGDTADCNIINNWFGRFKTPIWFKEIFLRQIWNELR